MSTILDYDLSSALNQSGACDYCHHRKMRCDKHKPQCLECLKRSIPCNYGARLKRGPKAKKQRVIVKPVSRIQKAPKSNSHVQAMLFELEFNKKMVEIWKNACLNENGGINTSRRTRQKFDPATEEFIRSPNAIQTIMAEFDATYRLVMYLPTFAANMDFATKIWQALVDISASDLLTMLSTFETAHLLDILEYLIAFMLCLRLSKYDDISDYIMRISNYVLDMVIYARDDYYNSYEITDKLLTALGFVAHYFKLTKNSEAIATNAIVSYDLFHDAKKRMKMQKDLEAKMTCRMIMASKNDEERRAHIKVMKAYDASELPAHVLFMANISISIEHLYSYQKDMTEANVAIEKALYFAKSFILQNNVSEQGPVERYYDSWTGVVHSEIAIRSGDTELSRSKLGRLLESYALLPVSLQRLLVSNIEFFEYSMSDRTLLISDVLPLLTNGGVTMTRTMPYAMLLASSNQQKNDIEDTSYSSNEISSPSNVDQKISCSSEEIVEVTEFYDIGADPFFEFTDFEDSSLNYSSNM